jgi:hypothetical protein
MLAQLAGEGGAYFAHPRTIAAERAANQTNPLITPPPIPLECVYCIVHTAYITLYTTLYNAMFDCRDLLVNSTVRLKELMP